MIKYSQKDQKLTFTVRVVPRASVSKVVGEHDGALRVRVAAPPVDGAANEELIRTLAQALKVSRSAVQITAGHSSKTKHVSVEGAAPEALVALSRIGQTVH